MQWRTPTRPDLAAPLARLLRQMADTGLPTIDRADLSTRYALGRGLELGPGHLPFPVPDASRVAYVDRWEPDDNARLFPELGVEATFPKPDFAVDLNADLLSAVPSSSQDFVIASHILEHVADPIGLLADIARVLRPGGHAIVLLPDRRRTFDHDRPPTPLEHVASDYTLRVREVDDEHIAEFIATIHGEAAVTNESVARFRRRSIHVHCWTDTEFDCVLSYCTDQLGQPWRIVEKIPTGPSAIEFGLVIKRGSPVFTWLGRQSRRIRHGLSSRDGMRIRDFAKRRS